MPRATRKSLKTLQHTASVTEILVGRSTKSLKHQLSEEPPINVEKRMKNLSTKETQVNLENKISADDLTNLEGASEKYWQILADKMQLALEEVLEESDKLQKIIKDLKEETALNKQMLEEANSFVEVIKEELANISKDDTGIDVNDVSTADEAHEEETNVSDSVKN